LSFGRGLDVLSFFQFAVVAACIVCLPLVAYLVLLYYSYRHIRFAGVVPDPATAAAAAAPLPTQLQIIGTGRQDKLRIPLSDWLFIQSEDNYIIVHSSNGGQVARHILRCTLREAEQQLGTLVLRCHRSTLVNPQKIVQLSGNVTNAKVTLEGYPHPIPVARQFVGVLREQHAID
jgi:DNA-binding LytR/AlgR family response regulator